MSSETNGGVTKTPLSFVSYLWQESFDGERMRRRILKARSFTREPETVRGEAIALECKECGSLVENCNAATKAVTCWRCVAKSVAPPEMPKSLQHKSEEKRPRGWQFRKRYVSPSGKVYSFGREVHESTEVRVGKSAKLASAEKKRKSPSTRAKRSRRKRDK